MIDFIVQILDDKDIKQIGYKRKNPMNTATSKPRRKIATIAEFFFGSKIGTTLLAAMMMLTVGIIPAILISMAP